MSEILPVFPTFGKIARRLGVPVHRVEYVLRARRILPAGRAGNAYLYSKADVDQTASELRRIQSEKDGVA